MASSPGSAIVKGLLAVVGKANGLNLPGLSSSRRYFVVPGPKEPRLAIAIFRSAKGPGIFQIGSSARRRGRTVEQPDSRPQLDRMTAQKRALSVWSAVRAMLSTYSYSTSPQWKAGGVLQAG